LPLHPFNANYLGFTSRSPQRNKKMITLCMNSYVNQP
jgi:hypothetical protein